MFKRLCANTDLMILLDWMLEHSMGEYTATNIQMFTKIYDTNEFVKLLHLLYTLGICKVTVDNDVEELFVEVNQDSELTQAFKTIKDSIEIKSFEHPEVGLVLDKIDEEMDEVLAAIMSDPDINIQKLIDECKNYKDIDIETETDESRIELYYKLKELDEEGGLEGLILFLQDLEDIKM